MLSREREWVEERRRSSQGSEEAGETKEKTPGLKDKRNNQESNDIIPSTPVEAFIPSISNAHITPFDRLDPAQLRIFTSEEKNIEYWTYEQILPARD
jgi:hypothetical protein